MSKKKLPEVPGSLRINEPFPDKGKTVGQFGVKV